MNDISNRTLATLLIAAIVVSLGGTLLSINKLSARPVAIPQTGRAVSDLGTAQISIQESLSIILRTDSVDFGTGYVNTSKALCTTNNVNISTQGTGTNYEDCFTDGTNPFLTATDFVLENNGNVNASVSVRGPSATDLFGTANALTKSFRWKGSDNPAEDALVETGSCQGTFKTEWTAFSANDTLCTDLDYSDETDTLAILVNMRFPWNQSTGLYTNSSITFYAVKS